MPLPKPREAESRSQFVSRCMRDPAIRADFKSTDQRLAVCFSQWGKKSNVTAAADASAAAATPCCDACASGKACAGNSGDIEPSNSVMLVSYIRAYAVTVTEKVLKGEKYLVFPVVLMTEGVRQAANAASPELILKTVFEKRFTAKGLVVPLVFTHPQKGKEFVGVNEPHDAKTGKPLGFIDKLKWVGPKLVGTAHMSVKLTQAAGELAVIQMERIKKKKMVEVSIGYAARTLPVGGTFNGKPFFGIQFDPQPPDHLALLRPQDLGACSVADGCGGPRE